MIRGTGDELAVLGTKGLDVNSLAKKYERHSHPGRYSGLQLVAIELVGSRTAVSKPPQRPFQGPRTPRSRGNRMPGTDPSAS